MSAADRIRELLRARPSLPWKVVRKRDRRDLKRDYLTSRFGFVVDPAYGDLNVPEDGELIVLLVNNAEALCDLADAARKMLTTSDYFDSTAKADLRAALARLDATEVRS